MIKKIELTSFDLAILNKIKRYFNDPNFELSIKSIKQFNYLVRKINKNFHDPNFSPKLNIKYPPFTKKPNEIVGLSGVTWDLSKMSPEAADYMRACIEQDIAMDKLMHPMKYMKDYPINSPCSFTKDLNQSDIKEVIWKDGFYMFKNKIVSTRQIINALIHGKRVSVNGHEIQLTEDKKGFVKK